MTSAKELLSKLKSQVDIDVDGGKQTLNELKVLLIDASTDEDRLIKLTALEYGVLLSVADDDMEAFQRNMAQAKALYHSGLSTSESFKIMGLNLMALLVDAETNLSEFHSELELIYDNEVAMSSPYISFPVMLERRLMVGSYNLASAGEIPDPSYSFFMESLMLTVRDSIARCLESSFRTLSLPAAQDMLGFDTMEELKEYMEELHQDWIVEDGELCFQPPPLGRQASDVPSMKLLTQSLTYATELERIV